MPAAIRMANGYTYYPDGFEHWGKARGVGSGSNMSSMSSAAAQAYENSMIRQGYIPNPRKDLRPDWDWVLPSTAKMLEAQGAAIDAGKAVKNAAVKEGQTIKTAYTAGTRAYDLEKSKEGKEGNAFGRTMAGVGAAASRTAVARGVRNEYRNVSSGAQTGAQEARNEYIKKHSSAKNPYSGSTFGLKAAGVMGGIKGGIKASTAYKVGKAAVGRAGEMLATGAGWVKDKAVRGYNKVKSVVGAAPGAIVDTAKKVGGGAVSIAKKIAGSPVGRAARTAGKAVLNAGGKVVGVVGGALGRIKDFFGAVGAGVKGFYKNAFSGAKEGYTNYMNEHKKDKK